MEGPPSSGPGGFRPPGQEPAATPVGGPEPGPAWQAPERPVVAAQAEKKPYAGWGYRVGAYLTDAGLALCVAILAALAFGGDDEETQRTIVGLTAVGVWILVTSGAMAVFGG